MKKNVVLFFCSLFLALFISELALRILKIEELKKPNNDPVTGWIRVPEEVWTEYHPELGWFHQKSRRAVLKKGKTLEVEVTTNTWGLRGARDYKEDRPRNSKRILVLGDSFVFGWGVRDNETLTAQIESQVPNLEALNLGVPGYGIDQIYLSFLKIGTVFRPDYVFIGIYQEDFWRATRAFTDAGYAKPYFSISRSGHLILHNVPVPERYQLEKDQFPDVILHNPVEKTFLHSVLYRIAKKIIMRWGRDFGILDPDLSEEWHLGRAILQQLIMEIRNIGAKPVLTVIPPKEWLKNSKPTSLQKSLKRLSERENVPLIDFTPIFIDAVSRSKLSDYYIEDEWHWTPKGHELAAHLMIQHLMEKGYVTSGKNGAKI